MIDLRVLGEIGLRDENGAELDSLLRQPKRLALLAYLAAPSPGTWHRRDMLLALFWPELDTSHARTSLRNAIYVLRQTLGDDVVRSRGDDEISIDPELLRTDLAAVWEALRTGKPDEALQGYGGDLLPGLFPPDSEGFQRWLDTERMRLKVSVSTASLARLAELESERKLPEALALARRLIEIQPDDETVVRRVISLHEAMGDRAGGLAVFESYRARLAQDFDAEPAPETVAVANRLRVSTPATARTTVRNDNLRNLGNAPAEEHALRVDTGEGLPEEASRAYRSKSFRIASGVVAAGALFGALAWSMSRPTEPLSIGKSTPLTAEEGLQIEAAISPNGRLVAYARGNAKKLRIFVQRIGGGPAWPLTTDSISTELLPRWSPDNDQLLFLSRNNAYVSPALGGPPRLVARGGDDDAMVRSASWSPEGDSIVLVRNDSLTIRPLQGSGSRFIGRRNQLHSCAWSPSRKWIACVYGNWIAFTPGPLFGNDAPSGIILYPSGGGTTIELTGHDYEHASPSWSADGRFLWMLSNRGGAQDEVYAVPIGDDGRASGPFVRVGLNAESISLSKQRIVYSVPVRRAHIWAIQIPGDTVASLAGAQQITSGNQVIEVLRASPDGQWLVYDSNLRGNADIYRIPVTGGPAEQLTDDPRPEYAGTLSPDGRDLAWHRWVKGERHLFVKRLDSDSAQEIMPLPGDQGVPNWSPQGTGLAAWSHAKERGGVFVVRRDATGRWKPATWRLEEGQLPVWSPDGQTIAFVRLDGSIVTIPADSGTLRTIYRPRPGSQDPLATVLVWRLDPGTIWFVANDPSGRGGIWSISARGGTPRLRVRLDDALGRAHGPGFTTDGKRFFFTLDDRISNIRWAELQNR